LSVLYT